MTLIMRDREKIAEGVQIERIATVQRMLLKGYSKEAIFDLEYTEAEYDLAEAELFSILKPLNSL